MTARIDRLRMNRFMVLGRVGMDLYADPPGSQIETATHYFAAIGGSAGNIAVALARQGSGAALLTRVSQDAVGRFCVGELARYGVDTQFIQTSGGEARSSLAVVETRAEDPQVVLYRNGAADFTLTETDVAAVDFGGIGALIVTGTALARLQSRDAVEYAIHQAKKAGALVVLDVDFRAYSWASRSEATTVSRRAAEMSDIVIGNDEEFALMAGSHEKGMALAEQLARDSAIFTVFKMGHEGSVAFVAGRRIETPIFPVKALKPMGAGDGFMGGLMAGLAQGHPLETAIQRGAATASIIVAGIGCAPASPTQGELDAFIRSAN